MTKLPDVTGREVIKALRRVGYKVIRQKGSHIRLAGDGKVSITVPNHNIGRGLLRKILRDSKLSPAEFIALLKK